MASTSEQHPIAEQPNPEVVGIAERALHLNEALNYYDTVDAVMANIREYDNPDRKREETAKHGASQVYNRTFEMYAQHQQALDAARTEFAAAYGMAEEPEVTEQYQGFSDTFLNDADARNKQRHLLQKMYEAQQGSDTTEEQQIVAAIEFPADDPDRKVSLARALRPEFAKLNPADYQDISNQAYRNIHPDALRAALINVPMGTRNARWCMQDAGKGDKRVYTTFVPGEWSTLIRTTPKDIAEAAFNHVEKSQRAKDPAERDDDASRRVKIHANERMISGMQEHVAKNLNANLMVIGKFKEAAQYNGGLARFGNEANMRAQMDHVWGIFSDMLWAARIARKERPKDEAENYRALEMGIYFAGTPQLRLDRFVSLLDVAEEWVTARKGHMNAMTAEAQAYVNKEQQDETERRARVAEHIPQLF